MIYCPIKTTKKWIEMESILGKDIAGIVYNRNNGNYLDYDLNGKKSKLFKDLLLEFDGDRSKALLSKAYIYSSTYLNKNNWIEAGVEPNMEDVIKKEEGIDAIVEESASIKEGVSAVFNSNPELSNIGTKEEYSKYLNGIFPESSTKQIVYRGINNRNKDRSFGIFFAKDIRTAKEYTENNNIVSALVNTKNIIDSDVTPINIDSGHISVDIINKLSEYGYDSLAMFDMSGNDVGELVIFEYNQIHILGSKEDIDGFKKFVSENNTQSPTYLTIISKDNLFSKRLVEEVNSIVGRNVIVQTESGYEVKQPSDITLIETAINELEDQFGYRPISISGTQVILNYRQKKGQNLNNEVFELLGENPTSKTVIQNVIDSNILTEEDAELARLLLESDIPINIVEDSELEGNAYMFTDGETISIGSNTVGTESTLKFATSILHEVIHTRTVEAIVNPKDGKDILFKLQMEYHYNRLKRVDKSNTYGFTSVEEFVAEIGSNAAFRAHVDNLVAGDNFISKFIDFVRKLIGGSPSQRINNSIKKYLGATIASKQKFSNKSNYYLVDSKTKNVLDALLKSSNNRIKALESRVIKGTASNKQDLIEQENKVLDKMIEQYRKGVYLKGIIAYCKNMDSFFKNLDVKIDKLKKDAEEGSYNDVVSSAGTIRRLGNFAYAYANTSNEIIRNLRDIQKENPEYAEEIKKISKIVKKVELKTTQLKEDYIGLSRIVFAKFLTPVGFNKSLDQIATMLRQPVRDISFVSRYVRNLQDSGDDVLGMLDSTIKKYDDEANEEVLGFKRVMISAMKKLENVGIKNAKFMIKKDSNGNNTHYFITERDIIGFRKKIDEFAKTLSDPSKSSDPIRAKNDNDGKWAKFFISNGVNSKYSTKEYNVLLEKKKIELGDNYKTWFELNAIYNQSGGHFTIPNDIDRSYVDLHKNANKSEYYWTTLNAKRGMEAHYPDSLKHLRRIPQIRKDFVESVKENGFARLKEMFGAMFKTTEDDTEVGYDIGLRDEKNNIIHFIPIYFNNKIKDPRDLSEDITSSMIMYGNMAIKRGKISTIVDMLEIGKDVIKDRGVVATSNRGKILKAVNKVRGLTFEEEIKEPTPGMIYERLVDFYKMNVYGQARIEGTIIPDWVPVVGGKDTERIIDAVGRYAGLRTLAMNVTAAANSVNVGSALTAMEAISKRVFDSGDLAFAETRYWGNVAGSIGDVGSREPTSKLGIWTEQMQVMNDFEEQIYNVEGEIKTKVGQFLMSSPLFFASRMNEHYMHNKVSLSVSNTFRYDPVAKKFVFKNEYFKELSDLKEQQRKEISELEGKVSSSQVHGIKSEYSAQIIELESNLNKGWDGLTNFWDAHEIVDGKLALSKEFEDRDARAKFIARQRAMNNSIQGMYGKLDKGAINMYALGRLGMMYRKWILPAFDRRFGGKMTDYEAQLEKEGYYVAFGRFMAGMYKDLKSNQLSIIKSWNTLSESEQSSAVRVAADAAFLFGISVLTMALASLGGGDDDDDWFLNTSLYLTNRAFSELAATTPIFMPTEFFKIVKTPLAGSDSIMELANSLNVFNWFDEIELGKFKGMKKLERNLIRTIPPFNTIYGTFFPEEKLKAYSK